MKQQTSPPANNSDDVFKELMGIAEAGGGHFFYSDIRKRLEEMIQSGCEKQAKKLALDIMKTYTHRPALIWELKKLLTNDEIADFKTWRKITKSNKPKAKCPKCESYKIARIVYGFPMFNKEQEYQLRRGIIILGGCCVNSSNPRYECLSCHKQFYQKPIEGQPFPSAFHDGKIIVEYINNVENIPVHAHISE